MNRPLAAACMVLLPAAGALGQTPVYDVVIYGGSSAGVAAAVQTSRMGKSVVLIEPGEHLGGLTSGGLGATDIGNKAAIGGISHEFYRRVKQLYADDRAWVHQRREDYRSGRQRGGDDAMWTFEPRVAEQIMRDLLREAKVPLVLSQRLDRKQGVNKQGARVVSILVESGQRFEGCVFIDATYEGDLLAAAGVSCTVGRESNSTYQETLNGVQTRQARYHQMQPGVDPYVKPGDPSSGLLPGVHPGPPGEEGSGDHRVQAYCFRMCLTDVAENRLPFQKPEGYDPLRYELLLRNFEAGERRVPWSPTRMPNRKTDTNNNFGYSTDNIGTNYDWAEAGYAEREKIFRDHLLYQQGLMWTLANHPRVPEAIRSEVGRWGLAGDEFVETGGWSHQLYVREARRMRSDYVMTQHNCQGRETVADPVGLAAYTMDSHHTQRYVDAQGHARNEGDVQVGGFPPYPISYRSLRPRKTECTNLLVPVCLSASHIAYGSIRMEPVFMVLGQSAATAACHAIDESVAVQDLDVPRLLKRLADDKQVLQWSGPRPYTGIALKDLPGIVIDDTQAEVTGPWRGSRSVPPFVGGGYQVDDASGSGRHRAVFQPELPRGGRYEVRIVYPAHVNRATNVPVTVSSAAATRTVALNQRKTPAKNAFFSLGIFTFEAGKSGSVTVSNEGADGYVCIDAVLFLRVEDKTKPDPPGK